MPTLHDPTWDPARSSDPEYAWRHMVNGNTRFVTRATGPRHLDDDARRALLEGQAPHAAVLGCSDSRVPLELILDQGFGDLFVVRTAGNVLDDVVLGSLEFAVEVLRVPLVVVLGHEGCGAITAARNAGAGRPVGHLADVLAGIAPAALTCTRDQAEPLEVRHVVDGIRARSDVMREAVDAGRLGVVGALYSLRTGEVRRLT